MEIIQCTFKGCKRTFGDVSSRKKHAVVHSGDMPFRCPQCMKAFTAADEFDTHFNTFHRKEREDKTIPCSSGQESFRCPYCALSCASISQVDCHISCKHQQQQTNDKARKSGMEELRCTFQGCDRTFAWPHHLQYHIKTHEGDRAHKCLIQGCQKTFYTQQQRDVHMKSHTGEKNFCCTVVGCGKKFITNQQLTNHLRIHTGEKPFRCTFAGCEKAFAEYSSLKKHTTTHTGEKPYQCQHCARCFSQSSTLHTHIKRHHLPANDNTVDKGGKTRNKSSRKQRKKTSSKGLNDESKVSCIAIDNSVEIENAGITTASQLTHTRSTTPVLPQTGLSSRVIVLPQPRSSSIMPSFYDEHDIYQETGQEVQGPENDFNLYIDMNNVNTQNCVEDEQVVVD